MNPNRKCRARQTSIQTARHIPGETGIWIMIFGDMLVFGLMFLTFMYYRRDNLPLYQASQMHLNQTYGLINTVFMLSSSWFVALSVNAARLQRRTPAALGFGLGLACALGFLICKVLEYSEKMRAGIVINTNDFYMFYYMFTCVHLLHVLIGAGVLIFMMRYAWAGDFTARKIGHLESGASFWHLVDLLWIALFALLYLIR